MNVSDHDTDRLVRGLQIALDMMVDDKLCALIVVGIHNDGRGIRSWSGGDERVADQVREQLSKALPFSPSSPPITKAPVEDDGA